MKDESVFSATNKRLECLETEDDIEPKRPTFDIVDIKTVFILERQVGTPGNLRHTGDAWLDGEQPPMILIVLVHFTLLMRTRPDKTHVPLENIEELRQLIKRIVLDEGTDLRLPRIILDLVEWSLPNAPRPDQILFILERCLIIRVGLIGAPAPLHIPELVHEEFLTILTDALIEIDHRAIAVLKTDEERNDAHDWQSEKREQGTSDQIEYALHDLAPSVERRVLILDDRLTVQDTDLHRDTGGLQSCRNESITHIIDLAVVKQFFMFIVRQGRIAHDDLVQSLFFAYLLDLMQRDS